jgi:hypothetical protein
MHGRVNTNRGDVAGEAEKEFWSTLFQKVMSPNLDASEPFSDFW